MASAVLESSYVCAATGAGCTGCRPGPCDARVQRSGSPIEEFGTGAVRQTGGKGRCDLLPHCAILRVSRHMEAGCVKYPERNWEQGMPMHSMLDSAMRHLMQYMDGQEDEDHLAAAASNVLMAMWTEEKIPNMQDIPSRLHGSPEYVSEATEWPSEARPLHVRPSDPPERSEDEGEDGSGS